MEDVNHNEQSVNQIMLEIRKAAESMTMAEYLEYIRNRGEAAVNKAQSAEY